VKRISALILLLMFLLCACEEQAAQPAPELIEPAQPQMQTATVTRGDLLNASVKYGNIFIASQPVAFSISGTVTKVHVIPGQAVQKGDVLASLNIEALQAQLDALLEQKAATSYANALSNRNLEINAEICRLNLDALVDAHKEEVAALEQQASELRAAIDVHSQSDEASLADLQQSLDAVNAQLQTISAEHDALEQLYAMDIEEAEKSLKFAKQTQYNALIPVNKRIEALQEQIAQATITAPMDGIVTWISQSARVSEESVYMYISDPNQKALRTAQQDKNMLLSAERIYAQIGSQEYELTVQEPDVAADSLKSMNNIMLTSVFNFEDGVEIPESANAMVFFVHSVRENVLILPLKTLSRDQNGYHVYKLTNGVQEKVYVKVGLTTAMNAEIISGLEEGDVVYVAG